MASKAEIVGGIRKFVGGSDDRTRGHWYVGIATDIEERLFGDHNVDKGDARHYIYYMADSEQTARAAEAELLDLGYDGGVGCGDHPRYVYAFLKTANTRR